MSTFQVIILGLCCIGVGMMLVNYSYKRGWNDARNPHAPGFRPSPPPPPAPTRVEPKEKDDGMYWVTCPLCKGNASVCVNCNSTGLALAFKAKPQAIKEVDEPVNDLDIVWEALTFEQAVRRMLRGNPKIRFALTTPGYLESVHLELKRDIKVPASYARKVLNKMRAEGIKV